jgi:hypothetical protein
MNNIIIKDKIYSGEVSYSVGDEVIVFTRKSNGYPKKLKDDISYHIYEVLPDGHLIVREKRGQGWSQTIKVHRKYMINKGDLRGIKLNQILNK